jgi:copper transport protein
MTRLAVVGLLAALALPGVAYAHASPEKTIPGFRARLARSPAQVAVLFNGRVAVLPKSVLVYDAKGRLFSGQPGQGPRGHKIFAPVRQLPKGAYTVRWRALSRSDGHVVSGVFTFGVRVAAPEPTDAYGASGPSTAERIVRWLYFVGLSLVIGGLGFRLLLLPRRVPPALERWSFLVPLIGVVGVLNIGALAFLLRSQGALQLPLGEFLYGDLSPIAGGTRFGTAFIALTLGFAVVSSLLLLSWLTERRAFLWIAFGLALAFSSGLSLSGHQASEPNSSWLSETADWVHLAAACLWAGGVVMLLVVFLTAPGLRRATFVRFARVAPVLIALLLAAGVYMSVLRLPQVSDLWTTGYGRILIVKLGLVALALAWGAFHHFVLEPRLERPGVLRRLPGSLAGESAVGMAVLLVAAILVNSSPPVPSAPAPVQARVSQR